ncbi:MAG: histidine kinase [Candidatus Rokuibacteriota bacterium]|nr:MAG: histidine kinase [Candidatus Rokubacteria bacterium]
MNLQRIGAIRRHLTAKLTIPFVVVLVGTIALLGVVSIRSSRSAMEQSLAKRAEILVTTLAAAITDPLAMGEVDRLQHLLDRTKQADPDVSYIIVLNTESKAVATTDPALKLQVLTRNEFERAMARVSAFVHRSVPGSAELFEVAAPVTFERTSFGVLRIGVSTAQVGSLSTRATWKFIGLGALALVAGAGIYLGIARRLVGPLRAAAELGELASGNADLTRRLAVSSHDEVGRLSHALNGFLDNLHGLVQEIRGAASQVGAASEQLSAASRQVASGAQEQASSLEETAASLEELTGTVRQNADNARQASQLAIGAREKAEKGGQVVTAAVGAMQEITTASKKIADIVTVIDEIAFQTNLLALNAAVEAARAGEQGRGFAVVATEVRTLAQRSAAAAKEIKGLIQDSVDKVHDGSELVNRSGQMLGEIVTGVKQVTDIVSEIAVASEEQSRGIEQVNRAVTLMDQIVQSNAAQTEELSSTAQNLTSQARELQELVRRFRVTEEAPEPRPVLDPAGRRVKPPLALARRGPGDRAKPSEPAHAGASAGNGSGGGSAAAWDNEFEEF